jgi:RNA polymerase sigma-70 factor, ECF subfamily
MAASGEPDTEQLLRRAAGGDRSAVEQLLVRHDKRLHRLIGLRMDRRLSGRIDPADVVQEALADAVRRLDDYLRDRPLPFYPWLRQLALERLAKVHRQHIHAQKRSVRREEPPPLPGESALELANRLLARGSSPSARLRAAELRARVESALAQLSETDREVLVLRHLEQLSGREVAAVLNISEGAVYNRHLRALGRFRALLRDLLEEPEK